LRIAVTYEDGKIFEHFGKSERFMIYDIEAGKVKIKTLINTNGKRRGALAYILKDIGVDALICGGVGEGAMRALKEAEVRFCSGITGETDEAVERFLKGEIKPDSAL